MIKQKEDMMKVSIGKAFKKIDKTMKSKLDFVGMGGLFS